MTDALSVVLSIIAVEHISSLSHCFSLIGNYSNEIQHQCVNILNVEVTVRYRKLFCQNR